MTFANGPFSGHTRDELIAAVRSFDDDVQLYGDIAAEQFESFIDGLIERLGEAASDTEAQQLVASAFPPDAMLAQVHTALGAIFEAWGISVESYNTTFITHDIVAERLDSTVSNWP